MIRRDELKEYLADYLAVEEFKDYCPNGLQVEGKEQIERMGIAVSASLEAIETAVDNGVDALLVHHGLFWKGDAFEVVGSKRKKLNALLKNDISLFAYHLPLDAHQEVGNNWRAAADMGWQKLEPFAEIGVMGSFEERSFEAFVEDVQRYYGKSAHIAKGGPDVVRSCALISGGAHKCLAQAAAAGVDCFMTGSFDEPNWHIAKEEGIHFLGLGHHNTEVIGPKALGEHIATRFGIEARYFDLPNPF